MSLKSSIIVGLLTGAAVGLVICNIALQHNPQGDFADYITGAFASDLYILFGVWAAVIALPTAAILAIAGYLLRAGE